jgi:hypothetical protein
MPYSLLLYDRGCHYIMRGSVSSVQVVLWAIRKYHCETPGQIGNVTDSRTFSDTLSFQPDHRPVSYYGKSGLGENELAAVRLDGRLVS